MCGYLENKIVKTNKPKKKKKKKKKESARSSRTSSWAKPPSYQDMSNQRWLLESPSECWTAPSTSRWSKRRQLELAAKTNSPSFLSLEFRKAGLNHKSGVLTLLAERHAVGRIVTFACKQHIQVKLDPSPPSIKKIGPPWAPERVVEVVKLPPATLISMIKVIHFL